MYPCLINALFTQAWTDADNPVGRCANILLNPIEHVVIFFCYYFFIVLFLVIFLKQMDNAL